MIILLSLFVKIIGNGQTKTEFIHRILELGECLCVDTLNVKRRLEETGLFLKVEVDTLGDTLLVRLKEYWYIWPLPIINYSFSEGLTLGMGLYHSNFRGYGENLYVYFTLGARKGWEFGWQSPRYRFLKRSYGFSIGSNDYESLIYRENIHRDWVEGYFSENITENLRTVISIGLYSYNYADKFFAYKFTLTRDKRDWLNYPRKGYALRGKLSENFGNFVLRRFDLQGEFYKTFGNFTISAYFGYSRVFGEERFYFMPNFIGTDDALRGNLPKERIIGRERVIFSLEPRFLLLNRIPFLSRFLDGGIGVSPFLDLGFLDGEYGYSLGFGFPIFFSIGDFFPALVYNHRTGLGFYLGHLIRIR
jgi:outer membrane protein assembly factor BamA